MKSQFLNYEKLVSEKWEEKKEKERKRHPIKGSKLKTRSEKCQTYLSPKSIIVSSLNESWMKKYIFETIEAYKKWDGESSKFKEKER